MSYCLSKVEFIFILRSDKNHDLQIRENEEHWSNIEAKLTLKLLKYLKEQFKLTDVKKWNDLIEANLFFICTSTEC